MVLFNSHLSPFSRVNKNIRQEYVRVVSNIPVIEHQQQTTNIRYSSFQLQTEIREFRRIHDVVGVIQRLSNIQI